MAIAVDATSTGSANPGTSVTVSHTCTGSDRILFTMVKNGNSAGQSGGTLSCTYNGVSMTEITSTSSGDTTSRISLFYLLAPATGTHDVVGSSSSNFYIQATSASYTGASGTQPDASNSATDATSPYDIAVTTIADNCWYIGCAANGLGNAVAVGTGTTNRGGAGSTACLADGNTAKTPAGSAALQWTGTGLHGLIIASFKPGTQVVGPANVKTYNDIASASTKTRNGTALASIKTLNGTA